MALRRSRSASRSKDDSTLDAAKIKELYHTAYKTIRQETYDYWLNYAFLRNQQWLWFNRQTNSLAELPEDPDRVQATINKVLASSRTIISKATSRGLRFDVSPTMADDATVRAAHIAEAIAADGYREHDWEKKREQHTWSMWRGGTAAVCVEWDPEIDPIPGEFTDTGRTVGKGDTVETVLSISEFVVEPGSRDAERARWWIRSMALPPKEVQARYHMADPPNPDATSGTIPFQYKMYGTTRDTRPELTLVLTYFERPNNLRPKGRILTIVNEDVVEQSDWYFPFNDKLNIAVGRETYVDDRWTGDTALSAARSIQTAINISWSSIIEHMKLAGNARLAVPQSTLALIDLLTDEPGEMVPYPDGTEKPSWLSPPQMPQWWIEQPDKLGDELDDILGSHDVSRGVAPPNIQSGYGISLLAENDATPLGRLVKETAMVWSKVASMRLALLEAKVKEKRTARVVVAGNAPETTEWSGKDLLGQVNAEVPVDAVLPRSRAAMEMFAEKMLQMGLVTSAAQFMRVADFPDQDSLIDAVEPDIAKARRENYIFTQGGTPPPDLFDDHQKHINEHNDFRKSARYDLLRRENPEYAKHVDLHTQGHATLAAEEMGGQQAKGAISPALAAVPTASGAPQLTPGQASGAMPPGEPAGGPPPMPPEAPPEPPPFSGGQTFAPPLPTF